MTKVTVDDAKGRLDRGEPILFLDARSRKTWAESDVKLPGAIRVAPDDIDSGVQDIPRDERSLITYCSWLHEASSARVAHELMSRGFKNVHALYGGFEAWSEAGYPVEPK